MKFRVLTKLHTLKQDFCSLVAFHALSAKIVVGKVGRMEAIANNRSAQTTVTSVASVDEGASSFLLGSRFFLCDIIRGRSFVRCRLGLFCVACSGSGSNSRSSRVPTTGIFGSRPRTRHGRSRVHVGLKSHYCRSKDADERLQNGLKLFGSTVGRRRRGRIHIATTRAAPRRKGNGTIFLALDIRRDTEHVRELANGIHQLLSGSNRHTIIVHIVICERDLVIINDGRRIRERKGNCLSHECIVRNLSCHCQTRQTNATNLRSTYKIMVKKRRYH